MQYIQLQGQTPGEMDTPLSGSYNLFADSLDGTIKMIDSEGNWYGTGGLVEVTYDELANLKAEDSLIAGTYYVITDFKTCYDQPNYNYNGATITTGNYKQGSVSPIIVFAISSDALAADAYQPEFPKDKIRYDITFNQTEVTSGDAFGRITYRKDNQGNEFDYDFRTVLFKRYDAYVSDSIYNGTVSIDFSILGVNFGDVTGVGTTFTSFSTGQIIGILNTSNNPIVSYYEIVSIDDDTNMVVTGNTISTINGTSLVNALSRTGLSWKKSNIISNTNSYEYPTFENLDNCFNNISTNSLEFTIWDEFTFLLPNNVFRGGSYRDNSFACEFRNNTFSDDFDSNTITDAFYNNIIDDDFDNNIINAPFYNNIIDVNFQQNLIMDNFYNNNFGDDDGTEVNNNTFKGQFGDNFNIGWNQMSNNTFNKNFTGNIILRSLCDNTFHQAYNNVFRQSFDNNTIGDNFYGNILWKNFNNNVLGNNFYDNDIYHSFINNNIGNYFYSNNIGTIETVDDSLTFEYNQIGHYFKANMITGQFERNAINNYFQANSTGNQFLGNHIGNYFAENDIGNNFIGNLIMGGFESNETQNNFRGNKISNNFFNNNIGENFGHGDGNYRGNVIGNNFSNNTIGENFYDNNIGDNFTYNTTGYNFQFNRIETPLDEIDFTELLGNLYGVSWPNGTTGTDGVYTGISQTSTSGVGTGAAFTITVSGGVIADIIVTSEGKRYQDGDTITISGAAFGGTGPLTLTEDGLSVPPVVYTTANSNIIKNFNGDLKLTYIGTSFGIVGILDPFD
jgi:hypothetical protein